MGKQVVAHSNKMFGARTLPTNLTVALNPLVFRRDPTFQRLNHRRPNWTGRNSTRFGPKAGRNPPLHLVDEVGDGSAFYVHPDVYPAKYVQAAVGHVFFGEVFEEILNEKLQFIPCLIDLFDGLVRVEDQFFIQRFISSD